MFDNEVGRRVLAARYTNGELTQLQKGKHNMKEKQIDSIGAIAPSEISAEAWQEMEHTLRRKLAEDEVRKITDRYKRDCALQRLNPGFLVGMSFVTIQDRDGMGYLEVLAASLAVDKYGCDTAHEEDVVWDAVISSRQVRIASEA